MAHFRCMAFLNNLDEGGTPRSRALADALKEAFSFVELWDEWGLDAEVTVRTLLYQIDDNSFIHSRLLTSFPMPAFIYYWHLTSYTS